MNITFMIITRLPICYSHPESWFFKLSIKIWVKHYPDSWIVEFFIHQTPEKNVTTFFLFYPITHSSAYTLVNLSQPPHRAYTPGTISSPLPSDYTLSQWPHPAYTPGTLSPSSFTAYTFTVLPSLRPLTLFTPLAPSLSPLTLPLVPSLSPLTLPLVPLSVPLHCHWYPLSVLFLCYTPGTLFQPNHFADTLGILSFTLPTPLEPSSSPPPHPACTPGTLSLSAYTPGALWVAVQNRGSRCKTCIRVHKGKIFPEYCENFDQNFLPGN